MDSTFIRAQFRPIAVLVAVAFACVPLQMRAQMLSLDPGKMTRIASVDERFTSYNIEMAEVTGGNFWKPYHEQSSTPANQTQLARSASTPAGMNPNMYQYQPPIDLTNPRLRKLAAALGPAYVRVSGTWANSVYFADSDTPPEKPPTGFSSVLTRKEWKGVIDFVHAVNGEIITSFATSIGTRDAQGVWTTKQASAWLAYTKSVGGQIAAAEFMNEPTYAAMGGAPKGYNAANYARDIAVFEPWLKKNSPNTIFLGPGSVGEGPFAIPMGERLHSESLLEAIGPIYDVFSYLCTPLRLNDAQAWVRRDRPQRPPWSRRNGFPALRRSASIMRVFVTGLNLASHCGSPKRRMPHVGAIPGLQRSSIPSVTWSNMPVWHVEE